MGSLLPGAVDNGSFSRQKIMRLDRTGEFPENDSILCLARRMHKQFGQAYSVKPNGSIGSVLCLCQESSTIIMCLCVRGALWRMIKNPSAHR
jgi:hypothetical protein